jgi:GNAT superfamily N-acetyltransferase
MTPNVDVRLAKAEDLNFVFSCWLRNYKHASLFAKNIKNDVFYKWHQKAIERIIERGAQIRIVHPAGDPETILGFACLELWDQKPLIHFVYIKKAFRGMGLAKQLLPEAALPGTYSHMTKILDLTRHPELVYNPYLI